MTLEEYAAALEYRLCRELTGMREPGLSGYWCDGLAVETFVNDNGVRKLLGHAWLGRGHRDMSEWRLELLLPASVQSETEIDWESLLPPENVTRWLAIDRRRKLLQIDPAAAVPDLI